MRTLALTLTALALLTFLPAPAQAQQAATVTLAFSTPDVLTPGSVVTFHGQATYTADYTAMLSFTGIPVEYTVTQAPAWANVVVSPSSDIFPAPQTPMPGFAYTVTRSFSVTVTLREAPATDTSDLLEIVASTSAAPLGRPASGKGAAALVYDAPDEICDEAHANELLALAREAADAYAKESNANDAATDLPASRPAAPEGEDLLVQNTEAKPLGALPWIALGGFALVGAGAGLVLRNRLAR